MESREHARAHRTSRRTISVVATLGLMAATLAMTASTAGAATCLATDGVASGSNLQTIIDGASTGDTIVVKGTCVGNYSIPGGGSATILTLLGKGSPKATLDGGATDSVVEVDSGTVTFKNLLITNGNTTHGGGGIFDLSNDTVNVTGTTQVSGNTSLGGGGILNDFGTLNLSGSAQVNGNTATHVGGGIFNDDGTVNLSGKVQVNGNSAPTGGGIGTNTFTTTNLSGKVQVNGNTSTYGGGIYNYGTVTMSGSAQVNGNTASSNGGGIYSNQATQATVTLVGTVINVSVKKNIPDDIASFS